MNEFMSIPVDVLEVVDSESLYLIKGGVEPLKQVNNQGTMCEGINNQGDMCTGINNQGGACGVKRP